MPVVPWDLHYDRRLDDEFLEHFKPGGIASSLAGYARSAPYPLDLQFRRDPKGGQQHGTLYAGLTAVLNVVRVGEGFRLSAHPTWAQAKYHWSPDWQETRDLTWWRVRWEQVEDYLEHVVPAATRTHATKEGMVQAAASVTADSGGRVMLDREVAVSFRDAATKASIMSAVTEPIVEAVSSVPGVPGKPPTSFGGECDLLALDEQGRLLAIEVKPRGTSTIRWAPAQATVYAELLRRWLGAQALPARPAEVLSGMLAQRAAVGLAPQGSVHALADPPEVVPVVAVQRGAADTYLDGLRRVQRALLDRGVGYRTLLVYEINLAGELRQLDY